MGVTRQTGPTLHFKTTESLYTKIGARTASLQNYCLLCCACHCVMLLSLCCSVVIMWYCYCVALLLFVLSYVLIVCIVPLPPGVNPIAADKYINKGYACSAFLTWVPVSSSVTKEAMISNKRH